MNLQGRDLKLDLSGDDVRLLQSELAQLGLAVPDAERQQASFGQGTSQAVISLQKERGLDPTGVVDAQTATAINQTVDAITYTVQGTVTSPDHPGLGQLRIQIVDKNIGQDVLLAETTTDAHGSYTARFVATSLRQRGKKMPDLQARVYAGQTFLAASDVHYNATTNETLDVNLPANLTALPSEYETLTAALTLHYAGTLSALQENNDRQDITYLANKTGWDARAVALAALADQFSQMTAPAPDKSTTVSLRPEYYYALFRAGLPANADTLFMASWQTVQAIWQQAIAQGVIPQALANDIPAAVENFQALSAAYVLDAHPPVGLSTLKEMLQTTLPNTADQEQFARLYAQYHEDWNSFWPALEQALGATQTKQLQFMGQLFYLTTNNAPLVKALMHAEGQGTLSSTLDLAAHGYYDPGKWRPLIGEAIPPGIPGANVDEQRSNYAQLLAAKVRVAFPTAVLADQVRRGVFPVADSDDVAAQVVNFLTTNQGQFEIGVEPVEAYIARSGHASTSPAAVTQIKRFQRVYQLTPDDTSMAVLLRHNLDSAFAITRYDSAGFVRAFQDKLGGSEKASAIHVRARQIFAAVLNVTVTYLTGRLAPTLGGAAPVLSGFSPQSSDQTYPVIAYPTLEDLFGSLDYCNCPDCGSILSPAAYLVDLLNFLDQPTPTPGFQNPQDVLFQRRPDLQYLPLTCENTNTALPYIDIVNEVLEFYVANSLSLANYQGHDTGDTVTSAELLASPQYVNDAAYTTLQSAFFPPPLPYNRPLALLRLQMQALGISLPEAMMALRVNDRLNATSPTSMSFGWSDILIEQLAISRDEYRLFTDSSLQLGDLYGLSAGVITITATSPKTSFTLQCSLSAGASETYTPAAQSPLFQTATVAGKVTPGDTLTTTINGIGIPYTVAAGDILSTIAANIAAAINQTQPLNTVVTASTSPLAALQQMSLQDFSRRLGVSYDDLASIIQTRFINPNAILIPRLQRLNTSFTMLQTVHFGAPTIPSIVTTFINALPAGLDATQYGGSTPTDYQAVVNWVVDANNYAHIMDIITVSNPTASLDVCSGASLQFRYSNPDNTANLLSGTDFLKLIRFIRLWQKLTSLLGGSDKAKLIEQTDDILNALYPTEDLPTGTSDIANDPANRLLLDAGFTKLLPRVGFLFQVMNRLSLSPDTFLAQLLACWAPIETAGANALYRRLFLTPTLLQQDPGAQTATVFGTVNADDVLNTSINGVTITPHKVLAGETPTDIAAAIANDINATMTIDPVSKLPLKQRFFASSTLGVITIKAGFTLQCSVSAGASETYTAEPFQIATVAGKVTAGDILTTTIDGIPIQYTVAAGDTLSTIAANIATKINQTTTHDPITNLPLNKVVTASASAGVITIKVLSAATPFTLQCSVSAGASETYTVAPSPLLQTATVGPVGGKVTPGDTLTTTINGIGIPYTVAAGDTALSTIAAHIADAINNTTIQDPLSGLPLNNLVLATTDPVQTNVITIVAVNAGAPFTLACSLKSGKAGTYTAGSPVSAHQEAAFNIHLKLGYVVDTFINTSINGLPIAIDSVAVGPNTAAQIARDINACTQHDQTKHLPLNSLVHASSSVNGSLGIITVTAFDPAMPFTLDCELYNKNDPNAVPTPISETIGWSQTATVAGTFTANTVLTTTIDSLPIFYTVVAGDTPATIAANIATKINQTTTRDPIRNQPLNTVVTASVSAGVITIQAKSPTAPFTLVVSQSYGGYTAGRQAAPFADNGYGDFLPDTTQDPTQMQMLFGHESLLCAACNLTGAEFALITTELGFGPSTPLTLANVSALFRYGWLAHTLGLSVLVFLRLRKFSGLDPFASLDPGTTSPVEPPIIRFIRLLQSAAAAGLTPEQSLYLLWNQDISGKSIPPLANITGLAFALRTAFAAVEAQFTLKDDPDGSIAQRLMTLVYGSSASDFFFGLLNKPCKTSVAYSNPMGQPTLPQPVIDASSGQLSYDPSSGQLSFSGFLDVATQTVIDNAIIVNTSDSTDKVAASSNTSFTPASMNNIYPGAILVIDSGAAQETVSVTSITTTTFVGKTAKAHDGTVKPFNIINDTSLMNAIGSLAAATPQAVAQFFTTYPELAPLYNKYVASTDPVQTKRRNLLNSFLPILKQKRKQEQALASITSAAAIDPSFARALLQDPTILHADTDPSSAAIVDLMAIETQGLSAQFFLNNKPTTTPDQTIDSVTFGSQLPTGSGGPIAGIWSGYITAPQDGFYDFAVATEPAAGIMLQIAGATVSGQQVGSVWRSQSPISLVAGALVPIVLTVTSIKTTLSVSWKSFGLGWQVIPDQYLYSLSLINRLGDTYLRFLKAASLATALSLTANEMAYLSNVTNFAVTTTCASKINPGSVAVFTPASMNNIVVGSVLLIDSGSAQETVTVNATTPTTFSAVAVNAHDGTTSPFAIVDASFPNIGQMWLNAPVVTGDLTHATATSLGNVLTVLLDFARIKRELSPGDERLLAVLQNPAATLPNDPNRTLLRSITGWNQASLNALLTQFFGNTQPSNLSSVEHFRRVYDAYAIVKKCRVSASVLISAITNAPSATTVGALQSALRALYAESDWLSVIRPINDAMRIQQRDALVASILQQLGDSYPQSLIHQTTSADAPTGATQLVCPGTTGIAQGMQVQGANIAPGTVVLALDGTNNTISINQGILAALPKGSNLVFVPKNVVEINTPDKLFEYFLIDVETQPPVETSRIRLALSSVQLFIERIVRNLEPQVSPSDIETARWQWMKRYRLWQANREVFLWPENWLYPELRDDQSPFFQQMMSSLLQSDITDDAATNAYLDYLTKLEEVAKLEPCGLYYQPETADMHEAAYVVARTAGAHRKYYFRQLQDGSWMPWTEVKIDCEDMPVQPIVWNGRLFLFWLKILKQSAPMKSVSAGTGLGNDAQGNTVTSSTPLTSLSLDNLQTFAQKSVDTQGQKNVGQVSVGAVLCWSEFYNGKWQPTKTSDINRPTSIWPTGQGPGTFDATGPGSFDVQRDRLRLIPFQFSGALADALVLTISLPGASSLTGGGFVLYNTHSLPVAFEDLKPDPNQEQLPAQIRDLAPRDPYTGGNTTATFAGSYETLNGSNYTTSYTTGILGLNRIPRYTEPPLTLSGWDAPFLFEDRRYLFYVTTTETSVSAALRSGFGILSAHPGQLSFVPVIRPLVLRQPSIQSAGLQGIPNSLIAGDSNPGAMQRYLSQQTTLRVALGSTGAIAYQGRDISPMGSIIGQNSGIGSSERSI